MKLQTLIPGILSNAYISPDYEFSHTHILFLLKQAAVNLFYFSLTNMQFGHKAFICSWELLSTGSSWYSYFQYKKVILLLLL